MVLATLPTPDWAALSETRSPVAKAPAQLRLLFFTMASFGFGVSYLAWRWWYGVGEVSSDGVPWAAVLWAATETLGWILLLLYIPRLWSVWIPPKPSIMPKLAKEILPKDAKDNSATTSEIRPVFVDIMMLVDPLAVPRTEAALKALKRLENPHRARLRITVIDRSEGLQVHEVCRQEGVTCIRFGSDLTPEQVFTHAFAKLSGDVVMLLDPHAYPHPSYLKETLGYFSDPSIAWLQTRPFGPVANAPSPHFDWQLHSDFFLGQANTQGNFLPFPTAPLLIRMGLLKAALSVLPLEDIPNPPRVQASARPVIRDLETTATRLPEPFWPASWGWDWLRTHLKAYPNVGLYVPVSASRTSAPVGLIEWLGMHHMLRQTLKAKGGVLQPALRMLGALFALGLVVIPLASVWLQQPITSRITPDFLARFALAVGSVCLLLHSASRRHKLFFYCLLQFANLWVASPRWGVQRAYTPQRRRPWRLACIIALIIAGLVWAWVRQILGIFMPFDALVFASMISMLNCIFLLMALWHFWPKQSHG